MRTIRLSLASFAAVLLCMVTSGCFVKQVRLAHLPTIIYVSEDCQLVDDSGRPIQMPISVWPGSKILWKNTSHRGVAIKFDDKRLVTRGEKVFMAPGERVLTRFRSNLAVQETRFVVVCKDPSDDDETAAGSVDHDGGKGPSPDICDPNNPKYDPEVCN